MFCTSASYLVARFHKVSVMHSRDTGPLDNLGPFGPIVVSDQLHTWCMMCMNNTYTHTYIQTNIHTYIQLYKQTYIHTIIHTAIHTYIHTYIHKYINTYMYINSYRHTYIKI